MKYFAEITNGIVTNICVAEENVLGSQWVEYSPDSEFRYNHAVIGCEYNSERDAFMPIKPHASWTLNSETLKYEPPIAKPEGPAAWDEANQVWNTPSE
jgi:hypothetical protein